MTRWGPGLPVGLLACLAAACSSASPDHVGIVYFQTTIVVTGENHVSKTFFDSLTAFGSSSCSQAAAEGDQPRLGRHTWRVPTPAPQDPVQIEIQTGPGAYRGPGRYLQRDLGGGSGAINIGESTFNLIDPDGFASLVVDADGSGTVVFRHAPEEDDSPRPGWTGGLSGSITWTCTS